MPVVDNTIGVFRNLKDRGRKIHVSRRTGIVIVIAAIALILGVGVYLISPPRPSAKQIREEQAATADKFDKWAKARDEAKKQAAAERRPRARIPGQR